MKITNHALKRSSQRAINDYQLLLVSMFGIPIRNDSECKELIIPDKLINKIRESLDRCKGKAVIVDNYYKNIITAYAVSR